MQIFNIPALFACLSPKAYKKGIYALLSPAHIERTVSEM